MKSINSSSDSDDNSSLHSNSHIGMDLKENIAYKRYLKKDKAKGMDGDASINESKLIIN